MSQKINTALHNLFAELNELHFDGILPPIELRFTGRLKTTGGQYFRKPRRLIQISSRYLELENAWTEIRDTLGHEMVHYWLDHLGLPCGHTAEFRKKLKSCGFNRYSRLAPVRARYHYQCPTCKTSYHRKRKGTWSCGPCSGNQFNAKFKLVLTHAHTPSKPQPKKTRTKNPVQQFFNFIRMRTLP